MRHDIKIENTIPLSGGLGVQVRERARNENFRAFLGAFRRKLQKLEKLLDLLR